MICSLVYLFPTPSRGLDSCISASLALSDMLVSCNGGVVYLSLSGPHIPEGVFRSARWTTLSLALFPKYTDPISSMPWRFPLSSHYAQLLFFRVDGQSSLAQPSPAQLGVTALTRPASTSTTQSTRAESQSGPQSSSCPNSASRAGPRTLTASSPRLAVPDAGRRPGPPHPTA